MNEIKKIQTVTSKVNPEKLGITLPHEHLFTDLRGPQVPDYAMAAPEKVVSVMKPYMDEIVDLGVSAIVECSTNGVGRNPEILSNLAANTPLHIIAPTGVYREAYVPQDFLKKSASELADLWISDILDGIDGTRLKAGFIKMSVSDEGITDIEAKNLKAAVLTSQSTGAVIASHTIGGELAIQEMDLLESYGLDLGRFIWTHAQSEDDQTYHQEAVKRGVYISIDAIGSGWVPDELMLKQTLTLIETGYSDKILLSHDAGWYDPSQPDGHPEGDGIRGYSALFKFFIPDLLKHGVTENIIEEITIRNPAKAFAF
jgi:phosphotriesterase-related protein